MGPTLRVDNGEHGAVYPPQLSLQPLGTFGEDGFRIELQVHDPELVADSAGRNGAGASVRCPRSIRHQDPNQLVWTGWRLDLRQAKRVSIKRLTRSEEDGEFFSGFLGRVPRLVLVDLDGKVRYPFETVDVNGLRRFPAGRLWGRHELAYMPIPQPCAAVAVDIGCRLPHANGHPCARHDPEVPQPAVRTEDR